MLEQLRKPRYIALGAVMVLVAAICLGAGTWQVFRFKQKHNANHLLRHNARAAVAALPDILATTTAPNGKQRAADGQFRRVTAIGSYDLAHQFLARERTVDSTVGFLVVTPLRTTAGPTLLVVRGFITADGNRPTAVAAPPTGTVTVTARVEPPELRNDRFGESEPGQVSAINPISAADRLGTSVYDGYAELLDKQPGVAGLTPIPDPDLSNPAGGAVEPQHIAYILQWYLFALLALAAPLVMARAESRDPDEAPSTVDEIDEPQVRPARTPEESAHAARMTDRYGGVRTP
ncbi:MAG: SURF1 family protein [Jatrophihabitans sp.]